tara:strand:- start:282 stop:548 length:267 start_codon:yes stop_codon:yes gene_type:complete
MGYNSQNDVESGEETRMENDSMATAKVHSGSFSNGNFMATPKYKGTAKKGLHSPTKMAKKDYDKDGQVESARDEHKGSIGNAIKANKK